MKNLVKFSLKLKDFEGPLDLLDSLIKQKKINVIELDVAEIANQYLEFVENQIDSLSIDDAGEYLEMSIYLLSLKTKKVIYSDLNNSGSNFEYERDMLIKRIIDYRKYKDIVKILEKKRNERLLFFSKTTNDIDGFKPQDLILETLPKKIDVDKLIVALNRAIEKYQSLLFIQKRILVQELSVQVIEDELWDFIVKNKIKRTTFSKYLEEVDPIKLTQQFVVTTFLALLDLCKSNKIMLAQNLNDVGEEIYIECKG